MESKLITNSNVKTHQLLKESNDNLEELKSGKESLSLVGLGYVGMSIAVAFAKKS